MLKISNEKSLLVFSVYHFEIVVTLLRLKTLILLGDNFDIVFQFDTFFFRIVQFSRYKTLIGGEAAK